ncbi:RIPP1 protein, partial [Eolophus roseicapillus]|nr:RIPP1 protein [Eolophus roseicapilla]
SAPRPLWRPWLPRAEEGTGQRREQMDTVRPCSRCAGGTKGRGRAGGSHPPHPGSPHRLLWPKSKSFDYLYAVGEKLLKNFPVQATLCLYEDSGSEEDEEEHEEDEEEDEEEEREAGDMPAGPPPHTGSAARPA